MTLQIAFLGLALALVGGAVLFLLAVIFRRGRPFRNLSFAILLIGLAFGVWYTSIRSPLPIP